MVSPDSEITDRVVKKTEYAVAGVPRYWIIERDKGNTVLMYQLGESAYIAERDPQSLAWLLNGSVPDLH